MPHSSPKGIESESEGLDWKLGKGALTYYITNNDQVYKYLIMYVIPIFEINTHTAIGNECLLISEK